MTSVTVNRDALKAIVYEVIQEMLTTGNTMGVMDDIVDDLMARSFDRMFHCTYPHNSRIDSVRDLAVMYGDRLKGTPL